MTILTYILDGKTPIVEPNIREWDAWMKIADHRTVLRSKIGEVIISTVFLGLDHSFSGGPPILFETLVFGGQLDQEMTRCSTWEDAEIMHKLMCERVINCEEDKP
jgi:hypothetical protein